jgi:two-component system chemotaxis sensor kinase CheA
VANRLRGLATIYSEMGNGTEIVIDIPMSLSAMTVLSVQVGDQQVLVPFDAVRRTLRLEPNEVVKLAEGEGILYEQRTIPFIALRNLLGMPAPPNESRKTWSAIVVQAGSKWMALGADSLLDTIDIVVKPLPPGINALPSIAGAAFDSQGDPLLVLDPMAIDVVRGDVVQVQSGPQPVHGPRLPILVIDDSLTTRMLEQSILEAAGYTVELSASADDALRRAHSRKFGLFIVDVEMPGMNGHEFTRITRSDPALSSIPVIMVTSLATADDRQRGLDAGASEYIVKGDFDQKHFVRKVAELLGAV